MTNSRGSPDPGWYPDPAGSGGMRWWDGVAWTGHLSAPQRAASYSGPTVEAYESSQGAARMIRTWYPVRTVAGIGSIVAYAVMLRTFIDFIDDLEMASRNQSTDVPTISFGVNGIFQLLAVASLVVTILVIVWILRAASFGAAAGMPGGGVRPKRTPGLAAASVIIPIVNFWWPWESLCDCLPLDHPARKWVGRWWVLFLVSGFAMVGGVVLAFLPLTLGALVFLALAALPIAELLVFRRLIDEFVAAQAVVARQVGLPV